ncbi:hypothetical protein ACFYS8_28040 [Kitasatospora sp. NPDC004615]|uniref:hypothetical protein n=1 Tax=Kitasatospora sp. NPDC004615 TaxID=3364017 RepID=UPI00368B5F77
MLLQLISLLGILGYDLAQGDGLSYLPTALGFSYKHIVPAPVGFFGWSTAYLLATAAVVFGAFAGGRWVRGAAIPLTAVNAYISLNELVILFTGDNAGNEYVYKPFGHLLLTLTLPLNLLIALAVTVVVAATRTPGTAPLHPQPGFGHPGAVPGPWGGAAAGPVPQPPFPHPHAPRPGLPQPPAGDPGAAYAYPPAPAAPPAGAAGYPPAPPAPPAGAPGYPPAPAAPPHFTHQPHHSHQPAPAPGPVTGGESQPHHSHQDHSHHQPPPTPPMS